MRVDYLDRYLLKYVQSRYQNAQQTVNLPAKHPLLLQQKRSEHRELYRQINQYNLAYAHYIKQNQCLYQAAEECIKLNSMGIRRPQSYEATIEHESEPHPEYSERLKQTIRLIDVLKEPLQQIEELKGSPLFDACSAIASQLELDSQSAAQDVPTVPRSHKRTLLPASGAKKIFSNIWSHFGKLAAVNVDTFGARTVANALTIMESTLIKGVLKPVQFFLHTLDTEGIRARENETYSQNNIARLGGVHSLTLSIPELSSENLEQHAETLQIALAQSLVQYLLNQKDMGGHTPDTIAVPDKNYSARTRDTAKKILAHLKNKGWDGLASAELARKLQEKIVIPDDLDKPLSYATHDYNLKKDQTGRDRIIDPKIIYDEQSGAIDLGGLQIQLFNIDASKFALTDIKSILSMPPKNLFTQMIVGNTSAFPWQKYPEKVNDASAPQPHFAVSMTHPNRPELDDKILAHRANHGRITTHLHLRMITGQADTLLQFTAHTPKDGQAASADMDAIGSALGIKKPSIIPESIRVNPYHPNTPMSENLAQANLEQSLQYTDVEIGLNFDSSSLDNDLKIINQHIVSPTSDRIKSVLQSQATLDAIHKLASFPQDQAVLDGIFAEVIKLLNPEVGRHTLLGLVLEQDGPTANCVFPFQKYARLAFALFPNISQQIQNLVNPDAGKRTNFQEMEQAIRLALTDQTLARLGLSPLGFLAIYSSESQALAQDGANRLAKPAKDKTDILYQLSELKKGLSSNFTSALSRFIPSISGGIGIINNRLTARLNLTNPNVLKKLRFQSGEIIPALYSKKIPLSQEQLQLTQTDFTLIQAVLADLENWANLEYRIGNPGSPNTFLHCIQALKSDENYEMYLKKYGVEFEKIDAYLQIIILSAAHLHFSKHINQWESFSSNLADHYAKQD